MVTLSFVITGCGAKSLTIYFKVTLLDILSIKGILKCNPFSKGGYDPVK